MKPMTRFEMAQMIDISAVRTHNTLEDIESLAALGRKYSFINLHVLPCWIKTLAELIRDVPDVYVGSPCGFPGGGHTTYVKMKEAEQMIKDGVCEMDIVMNVGKFKSGDYAYVLSELKDIISLKEEYMKTKVIIELNCLTDEELPKACELVIESGADFLKTGTGWVPGDANIERIQKIRKITEGSIPIKAAGGIRTREDIDKLLETGVERFGINTKSAVDILRTFD